MPNTPLPRTTDQPALLFVEPAMPNDSGQAAVLDRSRFCVTRAEDPRDVYLMRNVFPFSVAVLSDTIGGPALQASAEMVRGHWPKARILFSARRRKTSRTTSTTRPLDMPQAAARFWKCWIRSRTIFGARERTLWPSGSTAFAQRRICSKATSLRRALLPKCQRRSRGADHLRG